MRKVIFGALAVFVLLAGWAAYSNATGRSFQAQSTPGTPGPAAQKPGGPSAGTGKVVSVAPASLGPLKLAYQYTGTLESTSQVSIVPQVSGRLEKVMVDVGSQVKAGDVIAVLQQDTLQLAVQQAEANLASAQAKLMTIEAGGRPESVANAQAGLQAARIKLSQLESPSPSDIQAAQTAVDQATANLGSAQAKLDQLNGGPLATDLAAAESVVDQAKGNVSAAQAKLDQVKSPYTNADWATAQGTVDSARASLKAAQAKLDQVKGGSTAADLATAQAAADQAKATLLSAEDRWQMAQNGDLKDAGGTSNSALQQAYDSARGSYDAAVQKLQQLQSGPLAADLQAVQSVADSAQASLSAAQAKIDQMKQAPLPTDLAQAQGTLDAAKAGLVGAQAKLDALRGGSTSADLAAAQGAVDSATAALAASQAKLEQLLQPTAKDRQLAQVAVTQAQQNLALQQNPYTEGDLQAAKAAVDVAQAALGSAKVQLAQATLVAPFDGYITQKSASAGALVTPSTPIFTLYSRDLDVPVSFEESRMSALKPGLEATLAFTGYPGQTFSGKVAGIYPSADPKTHTFIMKIVPADPEAKLRAGMFASVTVAAEQRDNVLMVPVTAITQQNGKDVVFVVENNRARVRPVIQGSPSGTNVEIVSGLVAGEVVVIAGNTGLNDGDVVRTPQSTPSQPTAQPQSPGSRGGQGGQTQQGGGRSGQPTPAAEQPQGGPQ